MVDTGQIDKLLGIEDTPSPASSSGQISEELAHKLLRLNPNLRRSESIDSTAEFVIKAQKKMDAPPSTTAVSAKNNAATIDKKNVTDKVNTHTANIVQKRLDADGLISDIYRQYKAEKTNIEAELLKLKQTLDNLKLKYCNELMDELYGLDPNLSSLITQTALNRQRECLYDLQFSAEKYIERARQRQNVKK